MQLFWTSAVMKFFVFYQTRKFIIVLNGSAIVPYPEPVESIPRPLPVFPRGSV
jgi:hypothetical protein